MDIFESLENLQISEECFNDIVGIIEAILDEDYDSYKDQKTEEGSSQAYRDLANVNKSIRRNKTSNLKKVQKELHKARKEELAGRGVKSYLERFQDLAKEEKLLKKVIGAREDERDAQEEVDKALKRADRAEEWENR